MREILDLHFDELDSQLVDVSLKVFYELRSRGLEKAPATGELIHWIEALQRSGKKPEGLTDLPFPGILMKRAADLQNYRAGRI